MRVTTNTGALACPFDRELPSKSTFNAQWKEYISKFVMILEHIQNVDVYSLTIDILKDDLGNMWFVDASNYISYPREDREKRVEAVKTRLEQNVGRCESGVYCK